MGRRRYNPDDKNYGQAKGHEMPVPSDDADAVLRRLGLIGQVCTDCNARAPENAEKCRRCGCTNLRRRNKEFADDK